MTNPSGNPETQKQATGSGKPETGNADPRARLRIGSNIAQRLIVFASDVLRVAQAMPKDVASKHITLQLIRSATSVGANYEEGRAAESRADFIHKLGIATKELREAIYWLDLIDEAQLLPLNRPELSVVRQEAAELGSILGASIRTARRSER